jgi:hypothetical protein
VKKLPDNADRFYYVEISNCMPSQKKLALELRLTDEKRRGNMLSVFGCFNQIEDADMVVKKLQEIDLSLNQMNSIVQVSSVKNFMNITRHEITVEKTDVYGVKKNTGLEMLLGGEQPISLSDTGSVFTVGSVATTLARTAANESEDGLKKALINFGIVPRIAQNYRNAIYQGGLLLWLRLDDKKVQQVVEIMKNYNAQDILTIPH